MNSKGVLNRTRVHFNYAILTKNTISKSTLLFPSFPLVGLVILTCSESFLRIRILDKPE